MLVILIRVSTWQQFVIVTDLSGQMLTFDGVWHFGEVFSSRMNPSFHCTGQIVDIVCGVVWVSGLLMSTLWIEWPMVAVGLWYGQAYVMDNEHRCILLMAFWMHRDTVTRIWGPLLCHLSTTIVSCCSMIMHSPMLQGSVHNSWKLKTSQFLRGKHTHRACHPLSLGCSGSAYTTACSSSCQYPATSCSNWRGVDQHSTGPNQQSDQLYAKEMCCTAWGKWWLHKVQGSLLFVTYTIIQGIISSEMLFRTGPLNGKCKKIKNNNNKKNIKAIKTMKQNTREYIYIYIYIYKYGENEIRNK